mmetsp:Transcript_20918/g.59670  ORF Transcript_20918/g.59670 Transcript_20918/m.59670 type:complete len:101 (-) Transcript_20918:445-747(-)
MAPWLVMQRYCDCYDYEYDYDYECKEPQRRTIDFGRLRVNSSRGKFGEVAKFRRPFLVGGGKRCDGANDDDAGADDDAGNDGGGINYELEWPGLLGWIDA